MMKMPSLKLGLLDALKNVPRTAWIIVAWAVFLLSIGMAISLARRGTVEITIYGSTEQAARSYQDDSNPLPEKLK